MGQSLGQHNSIIRVMNLNYGDGGIECANTFQSPFLLQCTVSLRQPSVDPEVGWLFRSIYTFSCKLKKHKLTQNIYLVPIEASQIIFEVKLQLGFVPPSHCINWLLCKAFFNLFYNTMKLIIPYKMVVEFDTE